MCHVFHWDFVVKAGVDPLAVKERMMLLLDEIGAKYPAEHNVGNRYCAESHHAAFYRVDPSPHSMRGGEDVQVQVLPLAIKAAHIKGIPSHASDVIPRWVLPLAAKLPGNGQRCGAQLAFSSAQKKAGFSQPASHNFSHVI